MNAARVIAIILSLTFSAFPAGPGRQSAAKKPAATRQSAAMPESVGMSGRRLAQIDAAVTKATELEQAPGAVVIVGRKGRVVYRKAFGSRALVPRREPMTADTIFDLASLTKVVATATSVMILVERGRLGLQDPVALHIPQFARFGKERVTVEQLLTHRAGLVPDNDLADYVGRSADPLEEIYNLRLAYEPGTRFVYSDVGYILAGELVRRISGKPLDEFARENIFRPLRMTDTFWGAGAVEQGPYGKSVSQADGAAGRLPIRSPAFSPGLRQRTAPTEMREGRWMRGEVHDPRAYELGGVAGHAGLFSTADDLAVFCQMVLNKGEYRGQRVLSPYSVERMLSAHSLPASEMRGIGWDVNTQFSSNRGDLFPVGTFGHTGFTGTSIWIDPNSQTFVVVLTNRVHPAGKGDVSRLRSQVASIAAASITAPPYAPVFNYLGAPLRGAMKEEPPRAAAGRSAPAGVLHPVLTGVDVLERDGCRQLGGRRIALITNQTGRTRVGRSTIDVLAAAANLQLVAILAPEHGLRGSEDRLLDEQTRDQKTGVPVYSLYARNGRRPTARMLQGVDTIVFDVQDVGARFYTYLTTCVWAMEEAARNKMKFVVLDRPNPINGYQIEGPVAEEEFINDALLAFTAAYKIPVRHGMTVGEFAALYNGERHVGAELEVIKMEGWRRADYYDATALTWINPSPNMRSITQALLYPGVGLLETTNLSVGRGTDTPFEVIGAPWVDALRLNEALNRAGLGGVRFAPVQFTPRDSKYAGETCNGVNIIITDRNAFRPVTTGVEIAHQLYRIHKEKWQVDDYVKLLANRKALAGLKAGRAPEDIISAWQDGLAEFARVRRNYLLY